MEAALHHGQGDEDADGGAMWFLYACLEKENRQVKSVFVLADSSDTDYFLPGSSLPPGWVRGVLPHLHVRGVGDPVRGEPGPAVGDGQRFSAIGVRTQLVGFQNP